MAQWQKVSLAVGFSVSSTLLAMFAMAQIPGLEIPAPYWAFGVLCPALISAPVSIVLVRQADAIGLANARLVAAQAELRRQADRDDLTGALNRAAFYREAAAQSAGGTDACLLLIDIDCFKQVNDRYGHIVGDITLELVTQTLAASIRETDLIGRIGGDEFAVVLWGLPPQHGEEIAERARRAVEQLRCVAADGQPVPVSISVGLTPLPAGASIDAAIGRADAAMYRAKHRGRNRVVAAA